MTNGTRIGLGSALILALASACGSSALPDPAAPEASGSPSSSAAPPASSTPPPPAPKDASVPDTAPPPPKAIRFVAMGDTGKGNDGQQRVAVAVETKCKNDGCDFVQLLGDNIYESGVDSAEDPLLQSRFEQPYAKINVPFWVVLGNHDYGGNGAGTSFGKGKNQVDYTAKSQKWKLPSNFWHRTVENVEFFALDTNLIMFGRDDDQKAQIPQWLAASTSEWKIALGHHPYLSNGPHGNAGRYEGIPGIPVVSGGSMKSFMDDHVCGKVDVYISGHDHSSQWLEDKCKTTELIVGGAGAEGTELSARNKSYFQTNALSFFYIVIQGKKLTAELVDETGNMLFSRSITKP